MSVANTVAAPAAVGASTRRQRNWLLIGVLLAARELSVDEERAGQAEAQTARAGRPVIINRVHAEAAAHAETSLP